MMSDLFACSEFIESVDHKFSIQGIWDSRIVGLWDLFFVFGVEVRVDL